MNRFQKYLIYSLLLFPPLVFFTDLTRNPYYFQIFLLNELLLIFWIYFMVSSMRSGQLRWSYSPIDLPLLAFFGFAILTWVIALVSKQFYPVPQIIEEGRKLPGVGVNFLTASIFSEGFKKAMFSIINVLMAYFITSSFLKTALQRQDREKFFNATYGLLLFIGFIAAFYAILQYFMIEFIWAKALNPFGGRPVSTFGNPNFMSSYLLVLFPVAAAYYFSKSTSSSMKLVLFIIMAAYFAAIIATMTRSTWIGLFFAGAFMLFLAYKYAEENFIRRNRGWIIALGVMAALVFIFWPRSVGGHTPISRVVEVGEARKSAYGPVHQRGMIWLCAWDMVKDKPVLGKGWGLYELFYPFFQGKYLFIEKLRGFRTHANNAHNEILEIWSQTGTVGLGIYLLFMVSLFVYGIKVTRSLTGDKKLFPIAIMSGTLGMFMDNITGNVSLHFCVPAFLYWWNIGILSQMDESNKTLEFKVSRAGKTILTAAVVLCLFFGWKWYAFFMGEINYFKGFKYSKGSNVTLAVEYLKRSHWFNREVNSEYELGNAYARLGDKEKALWAYYQALSANCGYDEIHFNIGTVYSQMGHLDKSVWNYSEALYFNPVSIDAYLALGNIFLNNVDKDAPSAIKLFENSVHFYPNNTDLWNSLGFSYSKMNDTKGAVAAYRRALEANPDSPMVRHNLVTAAAKAGITHDPILEYESIMNRAEQKISEHNWPAVLELSRKLVAISPKSFKAQFYLANASFTTGKMDDAIRHYRDALALNPSNITVMTNLGISLAQKGEKASAREMFEKILQIEPQNKMAQEGLNRLRQ